MTAPVKPTSRDRLLDATAALAYREGVAVGVEALCKAAGVSKRSLYQLFAGKDELLAASLERRAADYSARLLPDPDDGRPPRARVLSVFERAVAQAAVPEYRAAPTSPSRSNSRTTTTPPAVSRAASRRSWRPSSAPRPRGAGRPTPTWWSVS